MGPACEGSCFQTGKRRSVLIADTTDRPEASQADAAEACRLLGGSLPSIGEAAELLHAGWRGGSNVWLWINRPIYWYNNGYGYALGNWSGDGAASRTYQTGALAAESSRYGFRCVFSDEYK